MQATYIQPEDLEGFRNHTIITDFYYEGQPSLHYQTCNFTRNIADTIPVSLADYVFLSLQAYQSTNETPGDLQMWFGSRGQVLDRTDIVLEYRKNETPKSPVIYKLFTEEKQGKTNAIVSIRGSQNEWDWLTNGQLWGAALFIQIVELVIPLGFLWHPVLDQIVNFLASVQSGTIEKVSYYKSVTAFVNYLKDSGNYTSVAITGHSLGGGLGIISGAQTGTQAVGISSPNAILSRHRLNVTAENLERYTFNLIPDRDIVPMVDEPTKNLQRIECRAPKNELVACHKINRILCELLFTCGSTEATMCDCVESYGYPEPLPKPGTTKTFVQSCQDAQALKNK